MSRNRIDTLERVENIDRRFGSASQYHVVWVRGCAGWKPALFTDDQIRVATERAAANPEDVTRRVRWNKALFTHAEVRAAVRRAQANPEDMPDRAPGTLREKVLRWLGML